MTNVIQVDIDLDELITAKDKLLALEKAVASKISAYGFVEKTLVPALLKTLMIDALQTKLSSQLEAEITKRYGTEEAIAKQVSGAENLIRGEILQVMKGKTDLYEKKIIEYMQSNKMHEIVAKQVEAILIENMKSLLMATSNADLWD